MMNFVKVLLVISPVAFTLDSSVNHAFDESRPVFCEAQLL